MRWHVALCAFAMLLCRSAYAESLPESCDAFAHEVAQKAISIMHDSAHSGIEKRDQLRDLFKKAVDIDWIGKHVLGGMWNVASPEQQKEYMDLYRAYITNSYISKLDDENSFDISDIKINSVAPMDGKPTHILVKAAIQSKGEDDVPVDFMLEQSPNQCRVHDIIVEGVSLLAIQNSEFQAISGSAGMKGVLNTLKKQVSNNN